MRSDCETTADKRLVLELIEVCVESYRERKKCKCTSVELGTEKRCSAGGLKRQMVVVEKEENMAADLNAVHILFNLDICGNEEEKIQSNQDIYSQKKEFETNNSMDNLDFEKPYQFPLHEKGGVTMSSEKFLLSSFGGMIDCLGYADTQLENDSFVETQNQVTENVCTKKRKWPVDDEIISSNNNSISDQDAQKIKHCHCGKAKNEKRKANLRKKGVPRDENACSDTKKSKQQKRVKFQNSKLKFTTDVISHHKSKFTPVNITKCVTQNNAEVDLNFGEYETISVTTKDGSLRNLLASKEVNSSNELPEEHQKEVEKFNHKETDSFLGPENETLNFEHSFTPSPENKTERLLEGVSYVETFTPTCKPSKSESLSCLPKTKEPVVDSPVVLTSKFDVDANAFSNLSSFSGIAPQSDSSSTKDDNHLLIATRKAAISCSLINSDSAYTLNGKSVNNVHQSDCSSKQTTDVTKREQESFVILSSQIDDCSMDSIPMIYIDSDDSEDMHCSVTPASQMEPIIGKNISKSDKAESWNVNADNCISSVITLDTTKDNVSVKCTEDLSGQAEITKSCKMSPNDQKEVGSDNENAKSCRSMCSNEAPLKGLPTTGQDSSDINESSSCNSDGKSGCLKATASSVSNSTTAFSALVLSDTLVDNQQLSDIIERSLITSSYISTYDKTEKKNLFSSGVMSDIKEKTDVHWTLQSPLTSACVLHNNKNNIINHTSPSNCIEIIQSNQCTNISQTENCSYIESGLITSFGPDCSTSSVLCNAKNPVDCAVMSMPLSRAEIDCSLRCQSVSLLSSSCVMSPLNHKKKGTLQPTYSAESNPDSSFEAEMDKYAGLFSDLEAKLERFESRMEENIAKESEARKSKIFFDERFNKLETRIAALQSKLEKITDNEKFSVVQDASAYDRQMKLEARVAGLEERLLTHLNSQKCSSECNKSFAKDKSDVELNNHSDETIMKIAGSSGPKLVLRGINRIIIDGEGYTGERE